MNDKQAAFAREYVIDYNATQAAIRAGYSEDSAHVTGSRLLRNAKVSEHIRKHEEEAAQYAGVTKGYILAKLRDSAEANFPHIEIAYDDNGKPVAMQMGNPSAFNKSVELLMKHMGLLVDRVEHSGGVDIRINGVDVDHLT